MNSNSVKTITEHCLEKSRNNSYLQAPAKYNSSFLINSKKIKGNLSLIDSKRDLKEDKAKYFTTLETSEFDNNVSFNLPKEFVIKSTMKILNENIQNNSKEKHKNHQSDSEEHHLEINGKATFFEKPNPTQNLCHPFNFVKPNFLMQEKNTNNLNEFLSIFPKELKSNCSLISLQSKLEEIGNNSLCISNLNYAYIEQYLDSIFQLLEKEIRELSKKIVKEQAILEKEKIENSRLLNSINNLLLIKI